MRLVANGSKSKKTLVGIVSVVSLAALTACVGSASAPVAAPSSQQQAAVAPAKAPAAPAELEEIRVVVKEWQFQPAKLELPAGRPVKLTLENRGTLDHDVNIPGLTVKLTARAGKTASTEVTAEKAGEYAFDCSVPGHVEAGMKGKLIVATGAERGGAQAQAQAQAQAAAAPAAAPHASHAAVATTEKSGNVLLPSKIEGDTKVFEIKAQHVKWEVLPGEYVDAYAYNGQVPGPLMRVTEGDKLRLNFTNDLPEGTVIHFHGPRLPNSMDGVVDVTQKVVEPGGTFTYEFVAHPAGTFVYHTHHNSAVQEPKGLYGVLIIDPKGAPRVKADVEVLQVLSEIEGNYVINGKVFPATEPIEAKVGQRILIHLANLGQMPHPMHLHGHAFKIVSTDGYPVPEAAQITKDVVTIGPGERYGLLVEVDNPGVWVFHCHILSHVQNHGVEPGGMITVIKVAE